MTHTEYIIQELPNLVMLTVLGVLLIVATQRMVRLSKRLREEQQKRLVKSKPPCSPYPQKQSSTRSHLLFQPQIDIALLMKDNHKRKHKTQQPQGRLKGLQRHLLRSTGRYFYFQKLAFKEIIDMVKGCVNQNRAEPVR